jgi:membrane associated rhomboid family serine protease
MVYPIRKPRWTFIFIGVCVAVFLLEAIGDWWVYFSFIPSLAFTNPWTFVTSIFLHADISHLFFNMFALFIFGVYLESRIKEVDFLLLFFLAGIAGNLGYMVTAGDPTIPGIGASGAIYGVIGALAILTPFAIVYVGYLPMPMIVAAFFWAASEFLGLFIPSRIAHGSHLGGLFFGIVYGFYLRQQFSRAPKRIRRVIEGFEYY